MASKKNMADALSDAEKYTLPFGTLNGTVINDDGWAHARDGFKRDFPEFWAHKEWTDTISMETNFVNADCCAQFVVD